MRAVFVVVVMLLMSGCACQNARNPQACRTLKNVLIASAVISASALVYEECRTDRHRHDCKGDCR